MRFMDILWISLQLKQFLLAFLVMQKTGMLESNPRSVSSSRLAF